VNLKNIDVLTIFDECVRIHLIMSTKRKISDKDWDILKKKMAASEYRADVDFAEDEFAYIESRGMDMLVRHARDFVERRLGPAKPRNEGKQTPLKGHPIFLAQHATGTNSRSALAEFHGIPEGEKLTDDQVAFVTDVILRWVNERIVTHKA